MHEIAHPNAITAWKTVRVDRNRNIETVLVVETNTPISPDEQKYDKEAFTSLVDAVVALLNKDPSIDRAELTYIRPT